MTTLYDLDAERALVGGLIIWPAEVGPVADALIPEDFGTPSCAALFAAAVALHRSGARVDSVTIADELKRQGATVGGAELVSLTAAAERPSPRHVEIVAGFALRRRLAAEAGALATAARDLTVDPGDLLDTHRARLLELDSPSLAKSPGDLPIEVFVDQDDAMTAPVIPGLLDEDDRAVVVAPEGLGKSEWLRQLATCPAYGLDPLTIQSIPPVRTLLVDLENPRDLVRRRLRYLTSLAARFSREREGATLWHRPGGVDLRRRVDRLALEDVLRRNRPRLVCFGPLYKGYTRKASESDEQVAAEVQAILDDLRTRFSFALVLEHHAPQSANGVRELRPFGSSLWLRWPEYGIKLTPDKDRPRDVLHLGRWRGDRSEARWPDRLCRDQTWPWIGWYRSGIDEGEER